MGLVDYVSSDEDDTTAETAETLSPEPKNLKRKRELSFPTASKLPPLPSKFYDLYASTTRVSTRDDSSLHGGRKRITPHVEGNWPSHVYVEWCPSTAEYETLNLVITSLQETLASPTGGTGVNSLLTSDLGAPLPLHISLSRPIVFTADLKDSFVKSLCENVESCGVRPFDLSIGDLDWVPNFERTRWFLVLRLRKSEDDELNRLLAVCNRTVEDHSQPPLYASPRVEKQAPTKDRRQARGYEHGVGVIAGHQKVADYSNAYHFSIGWSLEQPSAKEVDLAKAFVREEKYEAVKKIAIRVDSVKVKVGNIITKVSLPLKSAVGKSLYGF